MKAKEKILVIGAGIIGSIFAGKLGKAGYDVTVLSRADRLKQLLEKGILLRNRISGEEICEKVKIIESLQANDIYDFIFISVQATQIEEITSIVKGNASKNIVIFSNNVTGYGQIAGALGKEKVLFGFPAAGGSNDDGIINYHISTGFIRLFQATTIGEPSGKTTKRLIRLNKILADSGFQPKISSNMEVWQKYHVAVILPISRALNCFDSDNYELSKSKIILKEMILSTRELFSALKKCGYKLTPWILHYYYLPSKILINSYQRIFNSKLAEYAYAKHNKIGKDENDLLDKQFEKLIAQSKSITESYEKLKGRRK